jgi:hypothetical protein
VVLIGLVYLPFLADSLVSLRLAWPVPAYPISGMRPFFS